ncbi:MAG: TVP38/TMEM64 family protein [Phycisphaerales bacterium]
MTEQSQSAAQIARRLGPAGILAIGAAILPPLGSIALFASMGWLGPWLRGHDDAGVVLYIVAFAVLGGIALLPTYAQSALGGFAFGAAIGIPAAILGFAGGAVIGYEIARRASKERVMRLLDEHPKWRAVRDALVDRRRGFWRTAGVVALIRVPPNSPFALTNLAMAAVKVPWGPFVVGTIVGMVPRTAAAGILGAGVKEFTVGTVLGGPRWMIAVKIALMVGMVMLLGFIAKRTLDRLAGSPATMARGADGDEDRPADGDGPARAVERGAPR